LTGQSCTATGRILVHRDIHDEFVDRLVEHAQRIQVGDGMDPSSTMGPKVASQERQIAVERITTALSRNEGVLRYRSDLPIAAEESAGYFMAPTVIDSVTPESLIGSVELFSPVACITPVASFEEGISLCNSSRFALTAAVCTTSLESAHRFVDEIEAGIVKVNAPTTGLEIHMPFGGFKQSADGAHKELGLASFDFYTRLKSVYLTFQSAARPHGSRT
jgi:2,5-dioxopentanoate dehydrogenase